MPFFLLTLDENVQTQDRDAMNFLLDQTPNGTLLSSAQPIQTRAFRAFQTFRIYWLDANIATPQHIQDIKSMQPGVVKDFEEIDVSVTLHDPEWKFEDDYINQLFHPLLRNISKTNKPCWFVWILFFTLSLLYNTHG